MTPERAGLPGGGDRRVAGLRREELALLAGISVDYLVRLEQGRAVNPSGQVLAALSRSLQLEPSDRELMYRLAGAVPPPSGTVPREVPRGVQRMIDRMADSPVAVVTAGALLIGAIQLTAAGMFAVLLGWAGWFLTLGVLMIGGSGKEVITADS